MFLFLFLFLFLFFFSFNNISLIFVFQALYSVVRGWLAAKWRDHLWLHGSKDCIVKLLGPGVVPTRYAGSATNDLGAQSFVTSRLKAEGKTIDSPPEHHPSKRILMYLGRPTTPALQIPDQVIITFLFLLSLYLFLSYYYL